MFELSFHLSCNFTVSVKSKNFLPETQEKYLYLENTFVETGE